MDAEDMNPARFADSLQIGRAVISHILNGRNNPSLDVITRILSQMPNINAEWLLTGKEPMYKSENNLNREKSSYEALPDLFNNDYQLSKVPENSINKTIPKQDNKYGKDYIEIDSESENSDEIVKEKIIYREAPPKKVRQIIIYYTDNTFETFSAN